MRLPDSNGESRPQQSEDNFNMENKNVGILVMGISVVIGIIVFIFNKGLRDIVTDTCTHGSSCSMYETISLQTWMSLAIAGVIFILGLVIMLSKPKDRIVIKTIKDKKKKITLEGLDEMERKVIKMLQEENGAVFQRTLMEKLDIGKVGVTRLLDKLESKQLIERKRRGMNNIIVLKN
jgi:hypothetical protein